MRDQRQRTAASDKNGKVEYLDIDKRSDKSV